MEKLRQLTKEINEMTLKIEQDYPELYPYLDENPNTIPSFEFPKMDEKAYADYLDSLKQLVSHYTENQPS